MPRIKLSPLTSALAILLLLLDGSTLALIPFIAALCHELGHIIVMMLCGIKIREIEITLFGAEIRSIPINLSGIRAAGVYSAGAGANLLSAGVIMLIQLRSLTASFFVVCSLALAILNLLPIRTLDGGFIAEIILNHLSPNHAYFILSIISASFLVILWLFAGYFLLLCGGNISLFLFCAYMFAQLFLY